MFTFEERILSFENKEEKDTPWQRPYTPAWNKFHVMSTKPTEYLNLLTFDSKEKVEKFVNKQSAARDAQNVVAEFRIVELEVSLGNQET